MISNFEGGSSLAAFAITAPAALKLAINKREPGNWLHTAAIACATKALANKQWPRTEMAATNSALPALRWLMTVVMQTWWLMGRRRDHGYYWL